MPCPTSCTGWTSPYGLAVPLPVVAPVERQFVTATRSILACSGVRAPSFLASALDRGRLPPDADLASPRGVVPALLSEEPLELRADLVGRGDLRRVRQQVRPHPALGERVVLLLERAHHRADLG